MPKGREGHGGIPVSHRVGGKGGEKEEGEEIGIFFYFFTPPF